MPATQPRAADRATDLRQEIAAILAAGIIRLHKHNALAVAASLGTAPSGKSSQKRPNRP